MPLDRGTCPTTQRREGSRRASPHGSRSGQPRPTSSSYEAIRLTQRCCRIPSAPFLYLCVMRLMGTFDRAAGGLVGWSAADTRLRALVFTPAALSAAVPLFQNRD